MVAGGKKIAFLKKKKKTFPRTEKSCLVVVGLRTYIERKKSKDCYTAFYTSKC